MSVDVPVELKQIETRLNLENASKTKSKINVPIYSEERKQIDITLKAIPSDFQKYNALGSGMCMDEKLKIFYTRVKYFQRRQEFLIINKIKKTSSCIVASTKLESASASKSKIKGERESQDESERKETKTRIFATDFDF